MARYASAASSAASRPLSSVARNSVSPAPSGSGASRAPSSLWEGKFFAPRKTCGLDGADGDSRVVEDAVSLAPVGERVVRPTCEVSGEALVEGGEARPERAARGAAGAFYHPLRPRETDAPHLLFRELSGGDALQVVGGVGAQDLLVRYRAWRQELSRAADPIAR